VSDSSNAVPESAPESPAVAPVTPSSLRATRPLYWSVRRELWENRSIYIAPLIAAAVVLLGTLISATRLPERMRALIALDPSLQASALAKSYGVAAIPVLVTMFVVAVFYCLDALHGERRDRSILFWKSLPVSDLITVLSKASIPLVVLPVFSFLVIVATQLVVLLMSTVVLVASGVSVAALWSQLPLLRMSVVLLYGLIVLTLWYAPIYGWLLLVSGWARRTTFLWAMLTPLALCVVERIAFGTSYFASMLGDRLAGVFSAAFDIRARAELIIDLPHLDPVKFLSTPGLWIGLAIAAAFIAAAIWLRRYREPI
jgi:ABC-2 type transport system permease protein